jgi:hypothetical protein
MMAGRRTAKIFLLIIGLVLLYAFAVQATEVNLERPLEPSRQEGVLRVMRLLADPDFFDRDDETGQLTLSEASRTTLERIVETILMALLASTFGTVLAIPISFLAAKNLMENVTAPLAGIMAAIIALPVGLLAGSFLTRQILELSGSMTAEPLVEMGLLVVTVALLWFGLRLNLPEDEASASRLLLIGRFLVLVLLLIFSLGLLANLAVPTGNWMEDNLGFLSFLGNFVIVMGDFISILFPATIGLITGLLTASIGARYGQEAI